MGPQRSPADHHAMLFRHQDWKIASLKMIIPIMALMLSVRGILTGSRLFLNRRIINHQDRRHIFTPGGADGYQFAHGQNQSQPLATDEPFWRFDTEPVSRMLPAPLMKRRKFNIAVVGVTGAVGQEMLRVLEARRFPVNQLIPLASKRSAGKRVGFKGNRYTVRELTKDSFTDVDIALFSAGGGISKQFGPAAAAAGAVVVDNSSAFRMEKHVPLVVPEINGADVLKHKGIIANPNCSTIITLMALNPLHRAFGVKRIFASTYQAVSGSGAQGIIELEQQVKALARGRKVKKDVYPHQIAFNALPHVDVFLDNGYTKEEMKLENEGRKIMHHARFKASSTCVRIPVYRAHSISVNAEFTKPVTVAAARRVLKKAPGLDLVDDVKNNVYPLALDLAEKDNCAVGRIRKDCAMKNGLSFWVVGDQILKGAALNAVQIAEVVAQSR